MEDDGRMTEDGARRRFASHDVARFASVDATGQPHLVPVTFALPDEESIVFAVDHKPKTTTQLKRLDNVRGNPRVSFLVDEYDEDWSRLWWVRADGEALVLEPDDERAMLGVKALMARYAQYREHPPAGPVVWCSVTRWVAWSGA